METQKPITHDCGVKKSGMVLMYLAAAVAMMLALPFETCAQNQPSPAKKVHAPKPRRELQRLSGIIGYAVENENGAELGTVKDAAIDLRSGRLEFVIISTGGFAGIGTKLRAVPATALSVATTLEKTLALDIGVDRWNKAPTFSKGQLGVLNEPAQARWLNQYYGQPWPATAGSTETVRKLSPTGRAASAANLQLASEIKGQSVKTEQDERVGKVKGFLVDFKRPDATFALVEPGPYITSKSGAAKHGLFAVPMHVFLASPTGGELIADLTPGQFEDAKPLTADNWAGAAPVSGPVTIFRYEKGE